MEKRPGGSSHGVGEISTLEPKRAGALMEKPKVLVDVRNVSEPREGRAAGMRYKVFGRGYGPGLSQPPRMHFGRYWHRPGVAC